MSDVTGGVVADPGAAAAFGLAEGDVVTAVDGTALRDVIDWWWLTDAAEFTLAVERDGQSVELHVRRRPAEPLGVMFTETLFDAIRECDNACAFCFVSQLPKGLRRSLYVRDDDFRLSFLSGNFVTLTNVDDADVSRIIEQRLSPLHVSIHAVDPGVRSRLVCASGGDRALEILDELLDARIEVHVQIVLVPGVNDGDVLEETLTYLRTRTGVLSVGVVPMGFTAHQKRWNASFGGHDAALVLQEVLRWQSVMRLERGLGWVYAADEFYLLAGVEIPEACAYDGFPQFENGIGMTSAFRDEFLPPLEATPYPATLVTGEMFAPVLEGLIAGAGWEGVRVLPVHNDLFGGNVAVTGLLGGNDIADAIADDGATGTYLVPDVVVNSDGLLLDDVPARALGALAGADIRFIGSDANSLIEAITQDLGQVQD